MAARRCPKCGLINPESAVACDCGWSFATGAMGSPRRVSRGKEDLRPHATARIAGGGALLLFGVLITIVSYGSSTSGGTYVVAYGPMIVGALLLINGIRSMSR